MWLTDFKSEGKKQYKIKKSFSGVELSDDIRMVFEIDPKSMIFFAICCHLMNW